MESQTMDYATYISKVEACRACPCGSSRRHPAIMRGSHKPKLLFIGEAPGETEDQTGSPFTGPAGHRLDLLIDGLPIMEADWAAINIIKCRPPENYFKDDYARACSPFLQEQLLYLKPKLLVLLGRSAFNAFFPGQDWRNYKGSLKRLQRIDGNFDVFTMLHPAAPLHRYSFEEEWQLQGEALYAVVEGMVSGKVNVTPPPIRYNEGRAQSAEYRGLMRAIMRVLWIHLQLFPEEPDMDLDSIIGITDFKATREQFEQVMQDLSNQDRVSSWRQGLYRAREPA